MARKKKQEEHVNHERWLVSYADFITLLFAFFVVMYAISSVNEGKYRVLSDALEAAFRTPAKSLEPVQVGNPIRTPINLRSNFRPNPIMIQGVDPSDRDITDSQQTEKDKKAMKDIGDKVVNSLSSMMESDLVNVRRTDMWIEVEISSKVLFESGSALIQVDAVPILVDVSDILQGFPNAVRVEGFTDNIAIDTAAYPSNWELSAARAASVVHLFSDQGIDPLRLAATGYGEYRPVASNDTAEGRNRNRRVVLFILSEEASRLYNHSTDEAERFRPKDDNVDLDAVDVDPTQPLQGESFSDGENAPKTQVENPQLQSILDSIIIPTRVRGEGTEGGGQ